MDENPERAHSDVLDDDDSIDVSEEEDVCYKMVFVVNSSLAMGIGKIAAQVINLAFFFYSLVYFALNYFLVT